MMAWSVFCSFMMAVTVVLLSCFIGVVSSVGLMCSKCNYRTERVQGECMTKPPEPTRCHSSTDVSCMIAREYNKEGELLGYIRDCSTTSQEDKCHTVGANNNPNSPYEVCYSTCNSNGCNGSEHTVRVPWSTITFITLIVALVNTRFH